MKTPLYQQHLDLGARMTPFAGWDLPIQYEGILPEHLHTRRGSSVFDICHMGEFEISGPHALADMEQLVTQRITSLVPGQCRYGFLLNESGGVIDDLTVYRLAEDRFMCVVNAGTAEEDAAWIRAHLSPDSHFTDLSPYTGKIDIQGPTSREDLERVLEQSLPDLKYFRFTEWDCDGTPCLLSRTGYTGEWGYEIYLPTDQTAALWERLVQDGTIRPAGLGARDTLRLEVGYSLYGHELNAESTPVGACRGMFIDLEKPFIGREAVARELEQGAPRYLAGLRLSSKRASRNGDKVWAGDREVGEVTSGSLAPSLDVAVALAYLEPGLDDPGTVLDIEVRGKRLPAEVVKMPFYTQGTARRKAAPA